MTTNDGEIEMDSERRIGQGLYYDQMPIGTRFRSMGRTITETDLVSYINLTWFTEEVFVDQSHRPDHALPARVVPGGMIYAFAEGLVAPSLQFTGLAFLGMDLDVKRPTVVGDTIYVHVEVIESRPASSGNRGIVRARNEVVNQRGETVLVYTPLRLVRASPPSS
jgi:acyl dehydratase